MTFTFFFLRINSFRSQKFTMSQITEALHDWTSSLDADKTVDAVYFKCGKAFDRVSNGK